MEKTPPMTTEDEFSVLKQVTDNTSKIRTTLIEKLYKDVKGLQLKPDDDSPRTSEIKISMVDTLDKLLKSHETSTSNRIKLVLQKENNDTSEKAQDNIAELLKNISHDFIKNPHIGIESNADEKINKKFIDGNLEINDDELSEVESHE